MLHFCINPYIHLPCRSIGRYFRQSIRAAVLSLDRLPVHCYFRQRCPSVLPRSPSKAILTDRPSVRACSLPLSLRPPSCLIGRSIELTGGAEYGIERKQTMQLLCNPTRFKAAAMRGLWYVATRKHGGVAEDSNYMPWRNYNPSPDWLDALWGQHKHIKNGAELAREGPEATGGLKLPIPAQGPKTFISF